MRREQSLKQTDHKAAGFTSGMLSSMLAQADKLVVEKQLQAVQNKEPAYRAYEIANTGLHYRDKMRRSLVEILRYALKEANSL